MVPDPRGTELNRFQITNTSLPGTRTTLGRQRIVLDDSRFVGNVGFRQNEQTFDLPDARKFQYLTQNNFQSSVVLDASELAELGRSDDFESLRAEVPGMMPGAKQDGDEEAGEEES